MSGFGEALRGVLGEEAKRLVAAANYAVEAGTTITQKRLRIETQAGGLPPKIANAWKSKIFGRGSIKARGLVYSAAPDVHYAFGTGVIIKPTRGKYLCIPTNFNRAAGRNAGKPRITPQELAELGNLTFVRLAKNGVRYWMLRVSEATSVDKRKTQLFAGGLKRLQVGTGKHKRQWAEQIRKTGAVPMFVLVPKVNLRKRFDYLSIFDAAGDDLINDFLYVFDRN